MTELDLVSKIPELRKTTGEAGLELPLCYYRTAVAGLGDWEVGHCSTLHCTDWEAGPEPGEGELERAAAVNSGQAAKLVRAVGVDTPAQVHTLFSCQPWRFVNQLVNE